VGGGGAAGAIGAAKTRVATSMHSAGDAGEEAALQEIKEPVKCQRRAVIRATSWRHRTRATAMTDDEEAGG